MKADSSPMTAWQSMLLCIAFDGDLGGSLFEPFEKGISPVVIFGAEEIVKGAKENHGRPDAT